jgi:amino acid adenylation domain-containing protein
MTNLTEELSRLSVERRAVLELLLKKSRSRNEKPPTISRRKNDGVIPLSFGQQRMWFLDQLEPGNPFYNGSVAMRLTGRLDIAALERTLSEIARRHEALRTVFAIVEGQPRQIVMPAAALPLDVVELRRAPRAEQEAEARRRALEEAQRPFNLTLGPLLRAALLRFDEEAHALLLTTHHIIFDGWSAETLIKEMAEIYKAYVNGCESPLDELPIQYSDYACWQREWLTGAALEAQVAYWRAQLAGAPPALELPTDRPRLTVQSFRGGQEKFTVPRRTAEGLKALSLRSGATLFMTLLAAWQVALSRYTRQTDICIGVPISGRTRAEVEGLIGFFVNTLVVRTNLNDSPTFTEALRRVKETCLGAYEHQDMPFEKLVEELRPERRLTHSPLFQVMFGLHSGMPAPALAGLQIDIERTYNKTARFDLYLSMEDGEELKGAIEYSADLYDASTIRNMTGHIQTLLTAIVDAPERKITELQLLTVAERRRVLNDLNDTVVEYPSHKRAHELIEEQARRGPDSVAVAFEGGQLTYGELNRRSNQMAHYLRELGVGPEVLVGLLMERSIEMMIALLGALKSGGAYVPLDPLYPAERLAYIIDDARIGALLAQGAASEALPPNQAKVINIDALQPEIDRRSQANPGRSTGSQNLAYVIYTSGSTGRPKGVQIQHGSVVNFLTSMYRQPGIAEHDALLAVTTLSFDIAALELLLPLTVGARVVLVSRETATDGARLCGRMAESGASLMQATPATWRLLLQAGWEAERKLKILCGGEAWGKDLAAQLLRNGANVWNMYGPTETTIWSTIANVKPGEGSPPIGRPIANTQIYVLDAELNPVPIGTPGELYVGGDGLARGYLNRPDLTAERFIPDPFANESGRRLYRAGDLARHLSEGPLEYLGRVDHQVKIRGFRIELGEIEAVLARHPAVRQVVVIDEADPSGERRLTAYLVAAECGGCPADELRAHLRRQLPDYMTPSLMVWLDQMPLTPNGKIDRRALPEAKRVMAESAGAYVAPRTRLEESLTEIWREALGLEQVGIEDNFFEVGGHSLLATQVISRVRAACGVEVSLRRLFEAPRVSALAEEIESELRRRESADPKAVEQVAGPRRVTEEGEEIELSFAQQRLWFLDQLEPESSAYNIPSAVRLRGKLDVEALERAINEIVRRHEALRTVFIEVMGEPRQVVKPAEWMRLEVDDLREMEEAEREKYVRERAKEDGDKRFDLGRGPLLRMKLLRLGEEEHALLMTMHHIVSDGWSAGVLVREMGELYEAYRRGGASPLEDLGIQYGDYAVWQRQRLRGEELERLIRYWVECMRGAPAAVELPTDRPRPSVRSFRGAHETFTLADETVKDLHALCRREGVTLFMALLASFQALLYRYNEQPDIIVGTDIANRNNTEVEKLIGFFVNQIMLRTDLRGDPTFIELLRRVRDVCLGAYANQDAPFEKLVDALKPERVLNHAPLIQTKLVLFNAAMIDLKIGDLALSPIEIDYKHAQLDLIFNLVETGRGLRGRVEYSTDLFDAATIGRLWQEFEMIIRAVTTDTLLRLSDLKNILVEEGERQRNVEESKLEESSRLRLKGVRRRGFSMPM